jgi:alpha-galactosidase
VWGREALLLRLCVFAGGAVRLVGLGETGVGAVSSVRERGEDAEAASPAAAAAWEQGLPLVEIQLAGSGRAWSGERSVETAAGARLLYRGHEVADQGPRLSLRIDLFDPATGLAVEVHYRATAGIPVIRSWTRLVNEGAERLTIEAVTSLVVGGLTAEADAAADASGATYVASAADAAGTPDTAPLVNAANAADPVNAHIAVNAARALAAPNPLSAPDGPRTLAVLNRFAPGRDRLSGLDVMWADSDWLAEGRWHSIPLRQVVVDVHRAAHGHDPRGCFARGGQGSWSSGRHLPIGVLASRGGERALAWQVEGSGGWRWEVGEHSDAAYLALLGPTDREHHWRRALEPGEEFTSVPGALAHAVADRDTDAATNALAALTRYRRAVRRPHPDHTELPVIFNDYMNTLMGDPTTARLLPLIDAAARAGAEYFVIDAGWYDDAAGWWDSVGAWQEAATRFPGGLAEVCDHIRARGMTPGLWLEPEVVGVRSPVARALPDDAFFQRDGVRVVEHGRYHLDLRHPAARAHLDEVVDRLIGAYGVGYFKLDYNINPGPGTDTTGSPGAGLLDHQRAYTAWLTTVLDRHHALTIENCASGAMRADYGLLSLLQLQSTSDQQDFRLYPAIAAAAPAAMTPEQAAVWAYPQPGFTDDEITFTLTGALLGRIHLSGHLDRMTEAQMALVAEALRVYKAIRPDIAAATPFWPLGLPAWDADRISLGLRAPHATYLLVWYRGEPTGAGAVVDLAVPGAPARPRVLYPAGPPTGLDWNAATGRLRITLPGTPAARLIVFEEEGRRAG